MMRRGFQKPSLQSRVVDTFISTAIRHVAKQTIYSADRYISFLEKDLSATTIRCDLCHKLCRYSFDNVLYTCGHCRVTS